MLEAGYERTWMEAAVVVEVLPLYTLQAQNNIKN